MSCILVRHDTLSRVVVDNVARSNPGQSSMLGFLRPLLSGLDVMEFEQWANGFYFQYKFWLVRLSLVRYKDKIIRPMVERLKQN